MSALEGEVDAVWKCVQALVDANQVTSAKVVTKWSRAASVRDDYVIVVYKPNYLELIFAYGLFIDLSTLKPAQTPICV